MTVDCLCNCIGFIMFLSCVLVDLVYVVKKKKTEGDVEYERLGILCVLMEYIMCCYYVECFTEKEKEGNVISFLSLFPGELSPLYI